MLRFGNNILLEDLLIKVPGDHGGRREHGGVSGGHDGSGDGAEPEEGNSLGGEVLQGQGQHHLGEGIKLGGLIQQTLVGVCSVQRG